MATAPVNPAADGGLAAIQTPAASSQLVRPRREAAAQAAALPVQPPRLTALSAAQEAAVIELLAEALVAHLARRHAGASPDVRFPAVDGVMHEAPPSP